MKTLIVFVLALTLLSPFFAHSQVKFDDYFVDATLRIDFFHTGNATEETISIDRMLRQGTWAGNPGKLLDQFGYGHYYVKVYDSASSRLLYSRGFDTYFDEYKTTEPAGRGVKRTYHESVLIPYPKKPVTVVLEARDARNTFHPMFTHTVDPADYHILVPAPDPRDKVIPVLNSGDPHSTLDIVFVAEGYSAAEEDSFRTDLLKYRDVLLGMEPYRSHSSEINISGVFRPSVESGVTQPREHMFRNTAVRSSFNALDTDRYLLTEDNRDLRDIASAVPYDALCVMVNSTRYGGGGLYNDYTIFTARNTYSRTVFLHEFGHGFSGLGDEYYAADVSYVDFYPRGVEPVEPNLTALLDPSHLKWKALVSPGLAIPTEWGKSEYDSLQAAMGRFGTHQDSVLAALKKNGVPADSLASVRKAYGEQFSRMRRRITGILVESPLAHKIGAFEGAGYTMHGLYRPSVNCMMFSNEEHKLCTVCEHAVAGMIGHFAGE